MYEQHPQAQQLLDRTYNLLEEFAAACNGTFTVDRELKQGPNYGNTLEGTLFIIEWRRYHSSSFRVQGKNHEGRVFSLFEGKIDNLSSLSFKRIHFRAYLKGMVSHEELYWLKPIEPKDIIDRVVLDFHDPDIQDELNDRLNTSPDEFARAVLKRAAGYYPIPASSGEHIGALLASPQVSPEAACELTKFYSKHCTWHQSMENNARLKSEPLARKLGKLIAEG